MFKYLKEYSEGVAVASAGNGKYGLINRLGQFIFPPIYVWIGTARQGRCVVRLEKDGVINLKGEYIVQPTKSINDVFYKEGRLPFYEDGKYGFLDLDGNIAIHPQFDGIGSFNAGRCPVLMIIKKKVVNPELKRGWSMRSAKKWGVISLDGTMVVPPVYKSIRMFSDEGIAVALTDDGYVHIDKQGNCIYTEVQI